MRSIAAAARLLTRVAAAFLLAMVAINVLDVGLRSTINAPIFGTYEIVELMLSAVAFLAIPEAFLRNEHVTIELIDQIVSKRVVAVLKIFGMGATLVFMALLTYHMVPSLVDNIRNNDVSTLFSGLSVFLGLGV